MPSDSEEIQKLRNAGFDHDQARAVLLARAMANERAREEVIADMLRKSGFSAAQAQVIASSACRHAQPGGSRSKATVESSESPAKAPRRNYPSFALAGSLFGLAAIAIVAVAAIFHSSFSNRSGTGSTSAATREAILRSKEATPPALFGNTEITSRPVQLGTPAPTATPEAGPGLVFQNGKFVRVSQVSNGSPSPAAARRIGQLPTEEESRREAAHAFPTLPIKGSPFNTLFLSEYHQLRANSPGFFDSPDWPMTLAQTCHRYLSRHGMSSAGANIPASLIGTPAGATYLPASSGILFELYPGGVGPGNLRVSNDSLRNAICKLIDLKTGAKVFTLIVLAKSSYRLIGVPNGTYRLVYAHGDSVLTGTDQFAAPGEFAEFRQHFEIARKSTPTGSEYSAYDVTLDQGADGQWPTGSISAGDYGRY